MRDANSIVRERQLIIRRELDRRGISLKGIAFDAGLSYSTVVSYFPGEKDKEPHTVSGAALYRLAGVLPDDLFSLLLPDGFQVVRVPEGIDLDDLEEIARDFLARKGKAHHPDSPGGRELSDCERADLDGKAAALRAVVA